MNEKVEIEVKYSKEEYVRGMLFSLGKNSFYYIYNYLFTIIGVLISFIGVYYFIYKGETTWDSTMLVKLLVALLLAIPIVYSLKDYSWVSDKIFKKQYNSMALLQKNIKLLLTRKA
jgi:hypothetical protein